MYRLRQKFAYILLAVYLPMLVLSSVHTHTHSEEHHDTEECVDCAHHHCNGHINIFDNIEHDCVLCQFLTFNYTPATQKSFIPDIKLCKAKFSYSHNVYSPDVHGVACLRAPPAIWKNVYNFTLFFQITTSFHVTYNIGCHAFSVCSSW